MSVRHSGHSQPQSLPPFAVAFSNSSLDRLSSHPASLPPIQQRPLAERPRSLPESSQAAAMVESASIPNGRKRSHPDGSQHDDSPLDSRYALLLFPLSYYTHNSTELSVAHLLTWVVLRPSMMNPVMTRILNHANPVPIRSPHGKTPILDLCHLLHRHPLPNILPRNVA
jgi:hypothetical protein